MKCPSSLYLCLFSIFVCFLHLIPPQFPQSEKMFFLTHCQMCWCPAQLVCSESDLWQKKHMPSSIGCTVEKEKRAVSHCLSYSILTETTVFLTSSGPIPNKEWTAYTVCIKLISYWLGPSPGTWFGPSWQKTVAEKSIFLDWVSKIQPTYTIRNIHPFDFSNSMFIFWVTKKLTSACFICSPVPQGPPLAIPSLAIFLTSIIFQDTAQKVWSHCHLLYLKINQPAFSQFPSLHLVVFHLIMVWHGSEFSEEAGVKIISG